MTERMYMDPIQNTLLGTIWYLFAQYNTKFYP